MAEALSCDLVCEGGGVKGIGLAGAWSLLYERGYRPKRIAGTSAGAITAALIAAGYTGAEVKQVLLPETGPFDFNQFKDKGWEDRIPGAGPMLSILFQQGIFEGRFFYEWMRGLLANKGVRTFADLPVDDGASCLQVIVSDLTARELLVLPRDAARLGFDSPLELEVALAVRMSMSIPLFFEPVRFINPKTNREHLLVDGGMLSNFPVWLFDCGEDQELRWPTFGMLLVEPDPRTPLSERMPKVEHEPKGLKGLGHLLSGLLHTALEAHDRLYLERAQFARTISIPTLGVGTVEFELSNDRAKKLYQSGRDAAEDFLAHWDFEAYKEEFRKGRSERRREVVAEQFHQRRAEARA
ncbi:patatin-like phospholipase family protein [Archangium sp.]|uniref:patatin-like phospholipase family protein n=1 Tax=Archangium sp. TaxID=1872627 RepID=UPI00389A7A37